MSTEQGSTSSQEIKSPKRKQSLNFPQILFRNLSIVVAVVLVLCIPGFIKFRIYCQEKGYYVFPIDSIKWCVLGFFLVSSARYTYYRIMRKPIQIILNPAYEGQEKQRKIQMLLKLSFDTIFYCTTTAFCYAIFREQYWFPTSAGGEGSCSQIYKEYPNWPSDKRNYLEMYFMFHLGIHLFSIFELLLVRKQRKFYEWMMHHSVASSLILFSMMCNEIAAGVMILIVHDASDIAMAGVRFYFQAHMKKSKIAQGFMLVLIFVVWIYFRLGVFPFCLLANVYINQPLPSDQWYIIRYEYLYLLLMAFVLVGMHMYWTFWMFKSVYTSMIKKKIVNNYDVHKNK